MLTTAIAVVTPGPYASSVQRLQQRMRVMLQNVAHNNQQTEVTLEPDKSGLRTIVHVIVHPATAASLRGALAKSVNEYIEIHKGDCRPNTIANRTNVIPLNPIVNGVSQTNVDLPLSTLLGHGDVITTRTPGGTIIDCGSL